jgi:pyruvate/2-oxoglutarate dehydrogenase complex dihydrolipoamide acyltransferase (E2) component
MNAAAGLVEVRVPDMGNFKDVAIIDVLVKPGEKIEPEAPLVTLETEKATMDVPSTVGGVVEKIHIKKGGTVSTGDLIVTVRSEGASAGAGEGAGQGAAAGASAGADAGRGSGGAAISADGGRGGGAGAGAGSGPGATGAGAGSGAASGFGSGASGAGAGFAQALRVPAQVLRVSVPALAQAVQRAPARQVRVLAPDQTARGRPPR